MTRFIKCTAINGNSILFSIDQITVVEQKSNTCSEVVLIGKIDKRGYWVNETVDEIQQKIKNKSLRG